VLVRSRSVKSSCRTSHRRTEPERSAARKPFLWAALGEAEVWSAMRRTGRR
jgi:hypothetical protein